MRGKRILALLLALLLTLGLTACVGGETGSKTTKYAGNYRVSSLLIGGERYEYADLVAEGMADKV